jgi:hypothetical protein
MLYLKDLLDPKKLEEFMRGPPKRAERVYNPDCRCEDCYYETLGAEVERHPIGGGGIRR